MRALSHARTHACARTYSNTRRTLVIGHCYTVFVSSPFFFLVVYALSLPSLAGPPCIRTETTTAKQSLPFIFFPFIMVLLPDLISSHFSLRLSSRFVFIISCSHIHTQTHTTCTCTCTDRLVGLRVGLEDQNRYTTAGFSEDDDLRFQEYSCLSAFHQVAFLNITQTHPQLCRILSRTPCPVLHQTHKTDTNVCPSLDVISGLTSLVTLYVADNHGGQGVMHRLSDQGAASIASLPHLEGLVVVCPISEQGVQSLCSCATLKYLRFAKSYKQICQECMFPSDWLSCVHLAPQLSHISLPYVSDISEAITHIARMPSLSCLNVMDRLSDEHTAMLPPGIVINGPESDDF